MGTAAAGTRGQHSTAWPQEDTALTAASRGWVLLPWKVASSRSSMRSALQVRELRQVGSLSGQRGDFNAASVRLLPQQQQPVWHAGTVSGSLNKILPCPPDSVWPSLGLSPHPKGRAEEIYCPTVLKSLELTLAGRQGEQQGGRRELRGMSLLGPHSAPGSPGTDVLSLFSCWCLLGQPQGYQCFCRT